MYYFWYGIVIKNNHQLRQSLHKHGGRKEKIINLLTSSSFLATHLHRKNLSASKITQVTSVQKTVCN